MKRVTYKKEISAEKITIICPISAPGIASAGKLLSVGYLPTRIFTRL